MLRREGFLEEFFVGRLKLVKLRVALLRCHLKRFAVLLVFLVRELHDLLDDIVRELQLLTGFPMLLRSRLPRRSRRPKSPKAPTEGDPANVVA